MSEHAGKVSHQRAIDVVRGYAHHDAIAVRDALAGLSPDGWTEVYSVLNGLLRSTIGITELTGRQWNPGRFVRLADEVAAAAPLHLEFAIAEATRAWAGGGGWALRAFSGGDLSEAVHMTAVFIAVLGLALWGESGFLQVVETLDESVTAVMNGRPFGIPDSRP
ncbi:hypothetical protein ACFWVC_07525 [Streptomyces sp. NPDC058691]|uniref:hypothetical protein n=1 Tax=Streptomyces sp. NPDC058691 TaxID=3346601 RepID=UPI003661123A